MLKKGDLLSFNVVMISLAIIGFVILVVFLISFFDFGGNAASKEACHLSVIKRATLDTNIGNFQQLAELDCDTEKICITTSGKREACDNWFAGEKNVKVVDVSNSQPDEAKRIIEENSANAMYDCWSMMGEGKLDIFGKLNEHFSLTEPKCVICSRVAVANDVDENIKADVNVNDYLRTHQVPGSSLTYLQTFTDESVSSYSGVDEGGNFSNFPSKDFNQIAFVFMQVKTRDSLASAAKVGSFVLGSAFLGPAGKLAFTPEGALVSFFAAAGFGGAEYAFAKKSEIIAAGYCGDFTGADNAARGCSVVKGLEWDAGGINKLCAGGIEGRL